jgi:integrase/recombinase XerC
MKPPRLKLVKGFSVPPPELPPPSGLDEAIARFLVARKAIRAHTLRQYRRILGIYREISSDWPPTPEGIAAFIDYYTARDYEENTIYTYYSILRNFIKFAYRRRLISDNPLDGFTGPRRPGNLPRAPLAEILKSLTGHLEKQVERVLLTQKRPYEHWGWRDIRNLALFSLLLDSGLRVSEVVNVRLVDLDLKGGIVFVNKGKGSKQREAPFGLRVRGDLNLWLSWRKKILMAEGDPGRDYLFLSHRRGWKPMSSAHVEKTLTKVCREAGIERITPHQLRHACASLRAAKGLPLGAIQQLLGHAYAGTTLRYLMSREGLKDHLESSPRDFQ